jgi:hypothetical protein
MRRVLLDSGGVWKDSVALVVKSARVEAAWQWRWFVHHVSSPFAAGRAAEARAGLAILSSRLTHGIAEALAASVDPKS